MNLIDSTNNLFMRALEPLPKEYCMYFYYLTFLFFVFLVLITLKNIFLVEKGQLKRL